MRDCPALPKKRKERKKKARTRRDFTPHSSGTQREEKDGNHERSSSGVVDVVTERGARALGRRAASAPTTRGGRGGWTWRTVDVFFFCKIVWFGRIIVTVTVSFPPSRRTGRRRSRREKNTDDGVGGECRR